MINFSTKVKLEGIYFNKFCVFLQFNTCYFCRWCIISPMKIRKRRFYNFYMKFMIWLDCTRGKFPIPRLREGEKGRGKFSIFFIKPMFCSILCSANLAQWQSVCLVIQTTTARMPTGAYKFFIRFTYLPLDFWNDLKLQGY